MSRITLPKRKQPLRAFLVRALIPFTNYDKLEDIIYISPDMPLPEDLGLKAEKGERILRTETMNARIVIK